MSNATTHTIVELPKELDNETFIIGNLDMSGFYRVNYDEDNWHLIAKQLAMNLKVILLTIANINQRLNDFKIKLFKSNCQLEHALNS